MGAHGIGRIGEQIAVRHLERAGMVVLERNWRGAAGPLRGEIDIIARDGAVLVFCEVKARRGATAGDPLEAITARKLLQLRRLAGLWLASSALRPQQVRLDAVAVRWPGSGGPAQVDHLRGIG